MVGKKNFLSPYNTWKNFFRKRVTIKYPREDLQVFEQDGASPSYRGLHTNDLDKCIGCGTCEEICPTSAIAMIPGGKDEPGRKPQIPQIDYGRCCFCAFCVEVCTSGSLSMSRDYIHKMPNPPEKLADSVVMYKAETFRFKPSELYGDNKGFQTPNELSWLDLVRVKMSQLSPEDRSDSFIEIMKGYSREQAVKEASRCVECGICTDTCPAHMEVREYIRAIWDGDIKKAVEIIYHTNPLPNVCGRICTHKCETVCSVSLRGEPVAIRWLKRYAVDTLPQDEFKEIHAKVVGKKDQKIAVVGGGPAGLSAAYYLNLAGYKVTVYEALSEAGGMARVGAPEYRIPHEAVGNDVRHVAELGVEIKTNQQVGKDIKLEKLQKDYDAVFVSTGLHGGRNLGFEAEKTDKVRQAIELLRHMRSDGKVPVEKKVVVIGGGNVAFDIARSMARFQLEKFGKVQVDLVCVEEREKMLADEEEIVEGGEEGVVIHPGYGPKDIIMKKDKIDVVRFAKVLSLFDSEGRFNPSYDEKDILDLTADLVIESIGQSADYSYLSEELKEQIEWTPRRQIKVNEKMQSSVPWLFAGGDIVHGPDIIHGIEDGHRAARGIDEYLSNK